MLHRILQRSWLRLLRPPAELAVERQRTYQIFMQTYLFASLAHLAFVPVLIWLDNLILQLGNLACIAFNLVAISLHRHCHFALALLIKVSAILALITVGGMLMGEHTGFEYYFFIVLFEILISEMRRRFKLMLVMGLLFLSLLSVNWLYGMWGEWPYGPISLRMVHSLNLVSAGLLFAYMLLQLHFITERTELRFRIDASHDSLTGLLNRRAIFERGEAYWKKGSVFCLLIVDADHFKAVNDTHGHSAGDQVLRHLARLLSRALRDGDLVGRVGGEEFLLILPETSLLEARVVAERLRHRLAERPCRLDDVSLPITLSMGLAQATEASSLRELVELADRRLYMAKASGRDRLVMEGGDEPWEDPHLSAAAR
ncbi:GGDEF domain-containing protein [Litchfieldella xinjiangensis]|uniref:GGDEF domain-containing protein n=1 Tax=Litchfieldella xinjiangensis TaxID=1166948 RepID=UPI000693492B|nr:GGDEF domain-containing protein [Halomonas xinjiangensis]